MTKKDDELEELKRQVAELKAKVDPPKSTFVPMTDAEWRDEMRKFSERRMDFATPPAVRQYFAASPLRIVPISPAPGTLRRAHRCMALAIKWSAHLVAGALAGSIPRP